MSSSSIVTCYLVLSWFGNWKRIRLQKTWFKLQNWLKVTIWNKFQENFELLRKKTSATFLTASKKFFFIENHIKKCKLYKQNLHWFCFWKNNKGFFRLPFKKINLSKLKLWIFEKNYLTPVFVRKITCYSSSFCLMSWRLSSKSSCREYTCICVISRGI